MKYLPLGEIVEVLDKLRKPVSKKNRIPGKYPYYGATGIVDYIDDFIFDEELVLVGEDGAKWKSMEKTAFIISGKTWVNNHAHVLRPNNEVIQNKFLVYYLNFKDLSEFVTGVTVPKLNQERLRSIPIPILTLKNQNETILYLDEVFEKIEVKKDIHSQTIEKLEVLKKSLLNKIFDNE